MIMQFPSFDPRPTDADEVAAPNPQPREPVAPPTRDSDTAPKLASLADVRTMMVAAAEGAFDLRAGRSDSPYLEKFNALFQEHTAQLSAYPEAGATDLRFLLRRARTAFEQFGETVRYEIIEGVQQDTDKKSFDDALDCVEKSAIAAAASLGSIELALAGRA